MNQEKLLELIMLALGRTSVCWNPVPSGTFNDAAAVTIGEQLATEIMALVPQPAPSPAPAQ